MTTQENSSWVARILMAVFQLFHVAISPLLGPACRYHPTCSQYAVEAVRTHGAWTGTGLALRRLGRCHPFHEGGVDPVPPLGG